MAVLNLAPRPTIQAGRSALRRGLLVFLLLLGLPAAPAATTPAEPSREYQIKAVFLFNFTQFVEWPATAFPSPEAPFVIGLIGDSPFGGYLDDIARGERAYDRPLVVRRCRTVAEAAACQIVFIARSESYRLDQILAALRHRPTLTVGDSPDFTQHGGIVHLLTEQNKIRFRIDLDAARDAQLIISSKLLRAAEVVHEGKDRP